MIDQMLQEIGLSKNETKVYLNLLQLKKGFASVIGNRTRLDRNTVRMTCRSLVKRGLAQEHREDKTFCYEAEQPERILHVLEEKNTEIKKKKKKIQDILPALNSIFEKSNIFPSVQYYKGLNGIKKVYEDVLNQTEPIYAFLNLNEMSPQVLKYLNSSEYVTRRKIKNIVAHVIMPNDKKHKLIKDQDQKYFRETKLLNKEEFPIEIELNIYGNKVAFISYKKEEMFAIIIESSAIANSIKTVFNFLWKMAD